MTDKTAPAVSLNRVEEEVRRFWRRHDVPEATLAAGEGGSPYIIYQQPLLPVGQPVGEQIRLLAIADLMARYHSMRRDAVHRQAGWACHGLAIEVAVERSLGSSLASYDLARFNETCRAAAHQGIQQGDAMAERLGVWLDREATYATITPQAVSAVWGVLRRLWDAGRLKHQRRVVPVCPRCGSPLSMTEASRCAEEADSFTIWLRLPWDGVPDAYFLVWTPVPWTLAGMIALAAHPDAGYVLVELAGRKGQPAVHLLLAEAALDRTVRGEYAIVRRISGRSLRNAGYGPPFTFQPTGGGVGRVVLSETVPLDRGTGLLPVTPGFDAESLVLAQVHNLPIPELLDDWGNLVDSVTPWRGLSPLDAEPLLIDSLQTRGLLFRKQREPRPRPICPYCETPLLPQARDVWQVETSSGPWIVGRDRPWGLPLPVWVCDGCREALCVAGLDDLAHRADVDVEQVPTHRPGVDQLTFPCGGCGGTMTRVTPVVDAAFEAAVLPWTIAAQPGPADLAVGLGDKDLGWLGDLTEAAALLRETLAWQQAVAVPEGGGDAALDPERSQPADAVRWAVYTQTTPTQAELGFLQPLWRLLAQSVAASSSTVSEEAARGRPLDRWLLARLHRTTLLLTDALDRCEPHRAAKDLAALVDDVVDWYATLRPEGIHQVVGILCQLLAPFTPHLAEAIHRQAGKRTVESIHLAIWPSPDPAWEDPGILSRMNLVRRLSALGHVARRQAGVGGGSLLHQAIAYVHDQEDGGAQELAPCHDLLAKVLGVAEVRFSPEAMARVEWDLGFDAERAPDRTVASEAIEAALAGLGSAERLDMTSQLWNGLSVSVQVGGQAYTLLPGDVSLTAYAQPGWAAAAGDGLLVILETA